MKKILFLIVIISAVFSLTGCQLIDRFLGNNNIEEPWDTPIDVPYDGPKTNNSQGKFYYIYSLYDSYANVEVFKGIVPQGWYADIASYWNIVDHIHPGLEIVTLYNTDSSAKITIYSLHAYVDNPNYAEGVNYDYYTTYLHKMNASQYIEYFMNNNYPNATYLEAKSIPDETIRQLDEYNNLQVALGKQDLQNFNLQQYNMSGSIRNDGVTAAKEVYVQGDKYIEIFTGVTAITSTLKSGYSSLLDNVSTNWNIPFFIIYEANTKEIFDENYDDYNFMISNSAFTTDLYAMNEYVGSVIDNQYTSYYAAKSQAGLDAMNDYIDSNYSSDSSISTQDKVRQMWSDVINEVDNYKLEDGTNFRTSMFNETVAQNGNEIYVGSKAGIPLGFTEVSKSY